MRYLFKITVLLQLSAGTYLKLKIFDAALNPGWRLFKKCFRRELFSSNDKIKKADLFTKYQCSCHLLHLDQAVDKIRKLLRPQTQMDFQKGFLNLAKSKLRTQNFTTLKSTNLKQLIGSSCDLSVARLSAQCVNNSLIISEGRTAQAPEIHFIISFLSSAFKLSTSISLLILSAVNQSSYFFVQLALIVLFHETSGAGTYIVHPPGKITVSISWLMTFQRSLLCGN